MGPHGGGRASRPHSLQLEVLTLNMQAAHGWAVETAPDTTTVQLLTVALTSTGQLAHGGAVKAGPEWLIPQPNTEKTLLFTRQNYCCRQMHLLFQGSQNHFGATTILFC